MTAYSTTPLAGTFGQIIQPQQPDGLPDPEAVMETFRHSGAVLLRGFPFTVESFTAFSDQCCPRFSKYVGGGIRFKALDRAARDASGTVLSTTGSTQSFSIPLHGEMYYQKDRPDLLWFYCATPPLTRGQTTLADGREMFAKLSERSKGLLRDKRLKYERDLTPDDWHTAFLTDDIEELRRLCQVNELSLEVMPDNSVRIDFIESALTHFEGKEAFINNAVLLWDFEKLMREGFASKLFGDDQPAKPHMVVRFEDESELPGWLMDDIERVAEEVTVDVNWQAGDLVMVNNRGILHGRRKTVGEERDILVRLGHC